ncbi:hypothetical protein BJ986_001897 [Phycicoccus badiiscoriae]|uniref:Uncharacterized protein n=1 Tax=Pedococcus badiiscoriae TaxID=642776 RepID=A0A852WF71_9MICO|nr:hypothetical protein [Pedococcus badiiscoriae]NYG07410.1 hypothetical protein [Pedococcus badiiscoriae]
MSVPDVRATSTLGRVLLFILACILALVLPLLVMRQVFNSGGPAAAPPARTTTPAALLGATSVKAAAAAATGLAQTAEVCRLANLRQKAPLSAAEVSLAQFDKHIDAMNLLVAGKISLSVATTYWDQTRVKAAENARAFHRADQALGANAATCPALDPAVAGPAPYAQVVAIMSCARAITARTTALAQARTAVSTWEHHVHDMEMLRMGHITPAQAVAAWQKAWKTGANQLAAYDEAAAKATAIPCSLD